MLPVKPTEQLADAPLPVSVQFPVAGDTPAPLALMIIVPVGVLAVPCAEASVTVAVQLVA